MKDNTRPLYVNNRSDHPRSVSNQIPVSVEDKITQNSSNAHVFEKNKDIYQKELANSGYNKQKLKFNEEKKEKATRKQKQR